MSIKLKGSSDGSVSFDAPADTSPSGSDITLTLPTSAGSANQFLKNSGIAGELEYSSMVEDSSGRLLLGHSSSRDVANVAQPKIQTEGTNVSTSTGYTATNIRSVISGATGYLAFDTGTNWTNGNAVERVQITSAGRFKVTNTAGSGSAYYTNVNFSTFHTNTGGNIILGLENSASSDPYGVAMNFSDAAPDNNSNYFLYCTDESAVRCVIYSDGDVQNHDNSYSAISDIKLKQDIVDAGSQWEDLKNLRVRKFKFKSDVTAYGDDAKTLIGLVAQEAETVSPGLVADNPDKDSANNDLGTTTKSIRYSVLYMKAVKALQEAQTRIETLESQHADLLARVTALEAA